MYVIGKTFSFAAAHHLPLLPDTHKCARPHGHNYTVTVTVQSESLDETGFVLDYGVLSAWWRQTAPVLDHRDLNTVDLAFSVQPTAEALAHWFFYHVQNWLTQTYAPRGLTVQGVLVRETPDTMAEYRP